jgi:hypothetical protein
MYNTGTEILFPSRLIPILGHLRGGEWQTLVERVAGQTPDDVDSLAFVLLMVRLSACSSCHSDSFRALRGCARCASQAVRRYRGSDRDLVNLFAKTRNEVETYLGQAD